MFLTAEQRLVQAERRRQVLDLGNPLVHGSGEVVGVVQAAQDDAGEVDGLSEIAHQTALEPNHVPPVEGRNRSASIRQEKKILFVNKFDDLWSSSPLFLYSGDEETNTLVSR